MRFRVIRLLLCAIRHPSDLVERYGAVRCNRCAPIRVVRKRHESEPTVEVDTSRLRSYLPLLADQTEKKD